MKTVDVKVEELIKVLEEIASRGPVPGYERADALRLRLVGTQSIARAAIARAKSELADSVADELALYARAGGGK